MVPEAVKGAGTDSPEPEQSLRVALPQAFAGDDLVPVNLVIPGFNLDHHDLALILRTYAGENVTRVDLVPAPGKFFVTEARSRRRGSHIASIRYSRPGEKLYSPS